MAPRRGSAARRVAISRNPLRGCTLAETRRDTPWIRMQHRNAGPAGRPRAAWPAEGAAAPAGPLDARGRQPARPAGGYSPHGGDVNGSRSSRLEALDGPVWLGVGCSLPLAVPGPASRKGPRAFRMWLRIGTSSQNPTSPHGPCRGRRIGETPRASACPTHVLIPQTKKPCWRRKPPARAAIAAAFSAPRSRRPCSIGPARPLGCIGNSYSPRVPIVSTPFSYWCPNHGPPFSLPGCPAPLPLVHLPRTSTPAQSGPRARRRPQSGGEGVPAPSPLPPLRSDLGPRRKAGTY